MSRVTTGRIRHEQIDNSVHDHKLATAFHLRKGDIRRRLS